MNFTFYNFRPNKNAFEQLKEKMDAKDADTVFIANERLTEAVLNGMADHLKKNNFFGWNKIISH